MKKKKMATAYSPLPGVSSIHGEVLAETAHNVVIRDKHFGVVHIPKDKVKFHEDQSKTA